MKKTLDFPWHAYKYVNSHKFVLLISTKTINLVKVSRKENDQLKRRENRNEESPELYYWCKLSNIMYFMKAKSCNGTLMDLRVEASFLKEYVIVLFWKVLITERGHWSRVSCWNFSHDLAAPKRIGSWVDLVSCEASSIWKWQNKNNVCLLLHILFI